MKPIWLLAAISLLLGACADEHRDLKAWMANEAKGMQGKIQPLPPLKEFQDVDYSVSALVDPFQEARLQPAKGRSVNQPDENRRREPLEAYPLESLRMVGMMTMHGRPIALIQADRAVHQVRSGNYLGQNFGVITKITEGEITLKELIEDANGDWVERFSSLQLQEQETHK
ncbi:MAG: pilus assembly protein PilP [Candidatus Dactylopiibacterium carminicum]|uniref:Pilus assembly protein PilP n=1 Tax=Candidatus Dactylopiibacterium carminicum TaxID=857335 RepID=A0A272EQH3_9RHOO|nr:pilus assembly protein PilP [Candidatus Dactylopiibacterium carminicum]KAF7598604.1 pilus assembly protein PilP [Candidatus Dactylopiibacterium carminicum]PAS92357.1 MAG: pilus assembly protein PilP [Candidatus Dactylopiibacterium carminicum]PAS95803.1 MAG: pilus assembly protein PilP [Candidatus Dactylopiibacterium carminicum]PAS98370.1 MAG: pilus assembly protein PilP [Candidatus Dactylopiibacterium carminicum]